MKLRKELWFGFSLMALIIIPVIALMPWGHLTNGHLGLMMLALICVGIMLGFPTAFTLMGMGVFFAWLAYRSVDPATAGRQVLDLFVQRTYGVMSNDVLIAVPLFLFMGYLVERAQLIDKLFRSLHLATARVPGSLAVATIVTCAIFATATGIVGAVVTLMGLLAFPAMLKAGYNVKVAAGAVTAGGCLGILIPPSVLLIVYGAVAGVSVVQLYAGAFLPGFMLAGLYVGYIIVVAGLVSAPEKESQASTGLVGAREPEERGSGVKEPTAEGAKEASHAEAKTRAPSVKEKSAGTATAAPEQARLPVPLWLWILFGVAIGAIAVLYWLWNWERLEVFKMLLTSFFPLALMI